MKTDQHDEKSLNKKSIQHELQNKSWTPLKIMLIIKIDVEVVQGGFFSLISLMTFLYDVK